MHSLGHLDVAPLCTGSLLKFRHRTLSFLDQERALKEPKHERTMTVYADLVGIHRVYTHARYAHQPPESAFESIAVSTNPHLAVPQVQSRLKHKDKSSKSIRRQCVSGIV